MYEERKFTRYSTNIACEVNYVNESIRKQLYLKNISLEGMAFESDTDWEVSSFIMIHLFPAIEVVSKVIRCSPAGKRFEVGVKLSEKYTDNKQLQSYKNMLVNIIEDLHKSWE